MNNMNIRRQYICDCVESYIKNNGEEYKKFLYIIKQRRNNLDDKKFAKVANAKEMRVCLSLPDKLFNMLSQALDGVEAPRFLEVKGEERWFCKKYTQFMVPNEY